VRVSISENTEKLPGKRLRWPGRPGRSRAGPAAKNHPAKSFRVSAITAIPAL